MQSIRICFPVLILPALLLIPSASRADRNTPGVFAADTIKAKIAYLASDELRGRGSGEPGNEKAAQFVAEEFTRDGLKPMGTTQERDPNAVTDGSGYFQPFPFIAGRAVGKENRLQVRLNGVLTTYRIGQDFEPSGVSGAGSADGTVVFVGYGIHAPQANHDDYKGIDVKNKIVLLLPGVPKDDPHSPLAEFGDIRRKAVSARELGATAVLVVLPKTSDAQGLTRTGFDDASDTGLPVVRLRYPVAMAFTAHTTENLETLMADANVGKMVSRELPVKVELHIDVKKIEKVSANIIGMLEGSDPQLKDEYVVIGAHVDHLGMGGPGSLAKSSAPAIHHGADDNASGAAGVMELAHYFSQSSTRPKRSLVFMCFSGEELGLLGSDYYVEHPIIPLDKTVAMINMDMVGRLRDNKLIAIGSGTAKEWNDLLNSVNGEVPFALARSEDGFGASDQQSFYSANIPVLFFFTGTHADYHTPTDTVDKINAPGEAKVLSFVADCATRIADNPDRPTFQKISVPTPGGGSPGFHVYFGSVPDYAFQGEGVRLNGTRDGSPADKGGLKAGDVIVKFGDKAIKNIYDYTYALQDHKPNDKVLVVVKRGDKAVALHITLAARPE